MPRTLSITAPGGETFQVDWNDVNPPQESDIDEIVKQWKAKPKSIPDPPPPVDVPQDPALHTWTHKAGNVLAGTAEALGGGVSAVASTLRQGADYALGTGALAVAASEKPFISMLPEHGIISGQPSIFKQKAEESRQALAATGERLKAGASTYGHELASAAIPDDWWKDQEGTLAHLAAGSSAGLAFAGDMASDPSTYGVWGALQKAKVAGGGLRRAVDAYFAIKMGQGAGGALQGIADEVSQHGWTPNATHGLVEYALSAGGAYAGGRGLVKEGLPGGKTQKSSIPEPPSTRLDVEDTSKLGGTPNPELVQDGLLTDKAQKEILEQKKYVDDLERQQAEEAIKLRKENERQLKASAGDSAEVAQAKEARLQEKVDADTLRQHDAYLKDLQTAQFREKRGGTVEQALKQDVKLADSITKEQFREGRATQEAQQIAAKSADETAASEARQAEIEARKQQKAEDQALKERVELADKIEREQAIELDKKQKAAEKEAAKAAKEAARGAGRPDVGGKGLPSPPGEAVGERVGGSVAEGRPEAGAGEAPVERPPAPESRIPGPPASGEEIVQPRGNEPGEVPNDQLGIPEPPKMGTSVPETGTPKQFRRTGLSDKQQMSAIAVAEELGDRNPTDGQIANRLSMGDLPAKLRPGGDRIHKVVAEVKRLIVERRANKGPGGLSEPPKALDVESVPESVGELEVRKNKNGTFDLVDENGTFHSNHASKSQAIRAASRASGKGILQSEADAAASRIADRNARMRGQSNVGVDPTEIPGFIADHAVVLANALAKGGVKFAEWARTLPEHLKEHAAEIWDRAKEVHGAVVKAHAGDIAEVAKKLDPRAAEKYINRELDGFKDTVTVYRGSEGASGGGGFWTKDPKRAASYGKVEKVEVPRDVFEAGRQEAARQGQPSTQDTFLTPEQSKGAVPHDVKADVYEVGDEGDSKEFLKSLGIPEPPTGGIASSNPKFRGQEGALELPSRAELKAGARKIAKGIKSVGDAAWKTYMTNMIARPLTVANNTGNTLIKGGAEALVDAVMSAQKGSRARTAMRLRAPAQIMGDMRDTISLIYHDKPALSGQGEQIRALENFGLEHTPGSTIRTFSQFASDSSKLTTPTKMDRVLHTANIAGLMLERAETVYQIRVSMAPIMEAEGIKSGDYNALLRKARGNKALTNRVIDALAQAQGDAQALTYRRGVTRFQADSNVAAKYVDFFNSAPAPVKFVLSGVTGTPFPNALLANAFTDMVEATPLLNHASKRVRRAPEYYALADKAGKGLPLTPEEVKNLNEFRNQGMYSKEGIRGRQAIMPLVFTTGLMYFLGGDQKKLQPGMVQSGPEDKTGSIPVKSLKGWLGSYMPAWTLAELVARKIKGEGSAGEAGRVGEWGTIAQEIAQQRGGGDNVLGTFMKATEEGAEAGPLIQIADKMAADLGKGMTPWIAEGLGQHKTSRRPDLPVKGEIPGVSAFGRGVKSQVPGLEESVQPGYDPFTGKVKESGGFFPSAMAPIPGVEQNVSKLQRFTDSHKDMLPASGLLPKQKGEASYDKVAMEYFADRVQTKKIPFNNPNLGPRTTLLTIPDVLDSKKLSEREKAEVLQKVLPGIAQEAQSAAKRAVLDKKASAPESMELAAQRKAEEKSVRQGAGMQEKGIPAPPQGRSLRKGEQRRLDELLREPPASPTPDGSR